MSQGVGGMVESILFQFFCFPIAGYSLFCIISSEHSYCEKFTLFCAGMKCSLGFSACRCPVIYLLTVADSEDFIRNTDLKLINFKGR